MQVWNTDSRNKLACMITVDRNGESLKANPPTCIQTREKVLLLPPHVPPTHTQERSHTCSGRPAQVLDKVGVSSPWCCCNFFHFFSNEHTVVTDWKGLNQGSGAAALRRAEEGGNALLRFLSTHVVVRSVPSSCLQPDFFSPPLCFLVRV